jgi:hemolysin type calcium-binding protein
MAGMRTRTSLALAVAAALAAPASAVASTIEVTASAGPASDEYLEYRTTKHEANRVSVLFAKHSVVIVDRGTRRIRTKGSAFGRCKITSPQRAVCPHFSLYAFLRDGNDRLTVAPGDKGGPPVTTDPLDLAEDYEDTEGAIVETTYIDAGSGNDFVSGSKYNDIIIAGSGRDHVEGRDGPDRIYSAPDAAPDALIGGGDIDGVYFYGSKAVAVDLAAGIGGAAGEQDQLRSLERVHGGGAADVLRGTDGPDALYGEGAGDSIDGRGGPDLLVADSPITSEGSPFNDILGGAGDDIVDTRTAKPTPTAHVDCGDGADRHIGGVDAFLAASCESALPRVPFGSLTLPADEDVLYGTPMKTTPVAKAADNVTFEVPCPATSERNNSGCTGKVTLERPPVAGSNAPPEQFGSGNFSLMPGQSGNVVVTLTPAGQAAVAGADPVAVHVTMDLAPPAVSPAPPVAHADFGWQADL